MKKRLQGMVAGVLIGTVLTSTIGFAKQASEHIEAFYRNIKIYVNGVKIDPKDANGTVVEPFIYNGTTYLPARAIGEAVGQDVTWDEKENSVYIGQKPEDGKNIMESSIVCSLVHCVDYRKDDETFLMGGKEFTNGFTLHNNRITIDNSPARGEIRFFLEKRYNEMTLTLGAFDGAKFKEDGVVKFYLDHKLVQEYSINQDSLPQKITLPLNYAKELYITLDGDDAEIGLGNIMVKQNIN